MEAPRSNRAYVYVIVVFMVLSILLSAGAGRYLEQLVLFFLIYIVLAYAWNIFGGYAGQISLGNGAFFGLGGYISSILITAGTNVWISILLAGLTTAAVSLLLIPTFRLKGSYFAITTLFLSLAGQSALSQWRFRTSESFVIYLPVGLASSNIAHYGFLIIASSVVLSVAILERSRIFYAWNAIKADEDSAESLGIDTRLQKSLGIALMASLTGISGGLYVLLIGFADPADLFNVSWSVYPVFMVIIGGTGTFLGPIIGAAIFAFAAQILVSFVGALSLLAFGVLLILVALFLRGGIINFLEEFRARRKSVA